MDRGRQGAIPLSSKRAALATRLNGGNDEPRLVGRTKNVRETHVINDRTRTGPALEDPKTHRPTDSPRRHGRADKGPRCLVSAHINGQT